MMRFITISMGSFGRCWNIVKVAPCCILALQYKIELEEMIKMGFCIYIWCLPMIAARDIVQNWKKEQMSSSNNNLSCSSLVITSHF